MSEAELYRKALDSIENAEKEGQSSIERLHGLLLKNIGQLRHFSSTLLTINVAIIGAVFASLSVESQNLIKFPSFAFAGVLLLFIDAILIVFLTNKILLRENRYLVKATANLEDSFLSLRNLLRNCVDQKQPSSVFKRAETLMIKKFSENENELQKKFKSTFDNVYWLEAVNYLFIFGFSLVGISLLPIEIFGFFFQ